MLYRLHGIFVARLAAKVWGAFRQVLVDDDHDGGVWRQLVRWLPIRRGHGAAARSDEGERQSRFQIEPLEPRILLSGDPVASELARLVDDAAHATFVDDHAAIVEQVASDASADAGHADHDAQAGATVANTAAGDERGVQWPAAWQASDASEPSAATGKVDLRMAITQLLTAFAANSDKAEVPVHVVLKLDGNPVGEESPGRDRAGDERRRRDAGVQGEPVAHRDPRRLDVRDDEDHQQVALGLPFPR